VVLNEAGKSDDALVQFDHALSIKPNDILALCNKGQALYAVKKYNEAVDLYLKAIQIDPKSQTAHYWLGVSFADAGIYKEAISEWQTVTQIDPTSEIANTAKEGISVLQQMINQK